MVIFLFFVLGLLSNFLLPWQVFLQHLESVIKARIPSIIALINKTISELEAELDHLGRPIGVDAGVTIAFEDFVCNHLY